jgi:uncharacterized membrane protein
MANEQNLKPFDRADSDGTALATKQIQVRLPVEIDALVRALPDRSVWLRRVIVEAARRELMNTQNKEVNGSDS